MTGESHNQFDAPVCVDGQHISRTVNRRAAPTFDGGFNPFRYVDPAPAASDCGGRLSLTPKQRELLAYLERRQPECPSYREIARDLGIPLGQLICTRLAALEERGYIRRHYHKARSIEILNPLPIMINGERYRFIPKGRA